MFSTKITGFGKMQLLFNLKKGEKREKKREKWGNCALGRNYDTFFNLTLCVFFF